MSVAGLKAPEVLHSRLACAVILADGSIRDSNAAFNTLLGYRPEALSGLALAQLSDQRVVEALRHNALGDADGTGIDCHMLRADGTPIWVHAVASSLEGAMLLQIVSIERNREPDSVTRTIARRLELALEVSRIGVWEQDLDTGHVIWDRRMNEIYGRGQLGEALSERDWELSIHPADLQKAKGDFGTAVQTRSDYLSEFRIVLPDGTIRHIRSRGRYFPSPIGAGKLIGAEWDITHDVERTEQLYDARMLAEARFKDLQQAQKRIHHAALHDHLTDLPNRRYLDQELAERSSLANNNGRHLAVLHVDLDWFKQINDRFGHAAGDHMLKHVATTLRRAVRNDDFIARVGGDEFVILSWVGDSEAPIRADASRIIEALTQPIPYDGEVLEVGASIGIAYAGPEPIAAETLLRQADVALYLAKAHGRNRYEFAPKNAAPKAAARS